MSEELKLVFPTEEYRKQVMEYLEEYFDNNEYELNGDGELDKLKDFDKWLEKVRNDVSEKTSSSNRVPATLYLCIRTSDNRLIGMLQIRHKLNENLLKHSGHIGDGIRPSERNKGYGTKMIRLALIKVKELGIDRVLMTCDKDNIASAKTIIKNGGVLENELDLGNNEIIQRYWISLKKRFGNPENHKSIIEKEYKNIQVDTEEFTGNISLIKINKVKNNWYVDEEERCILGDDFRWLVIYPKDKKYCITAMYNEKRQIVEWYIDIARETGIENGIPYEDDLYLDVVIVPDGRIHLLDEDELKEAYNRYEVSRDEYDMAYEVANNIIDNINEKNINRLKNFTDKYLYILEEQMK